MDNDFLHKINLDALQKELKMSVDEIGNLVQLKNTKGVYKWSKSQNENGSRPSFNALIRLLKEGATVETFFGVEYRQKENPSINVEMSEILKNPLFLKGMENALSDIENRKRTSNSYEKNDTK